MDYTGLNKDTVGKFLYELVNVYVYGIAFEEVAGEFLIEVNKLEKFSVKFSKIGKWW